jgi:hypothetical protein
VRAGGGVFGGGGPAPGPRVERAPSGAVGLGIRRGSLPRRPRLRQDRGVETFIIALIVLGAAVVTLGILVLLLGSAVTAVVDKRRAAAAPTRRPPGGVASR